MCLEGRVFGQCVLSGMAWESGTWTSTFSGKENEKCHKKDGVMEFSRGVDISVMHERNCEWRKEQTRVDDKESDGGFKVRYQQIG